KDLACNNHPLLSLVQKGTNGNFVPSFLGSLACDWTKGSGNLKDSGRKGRWLPWETGRRARLLMNEACLCEACESGTRRRSTARGSRWSKVMRESWNEGSTIRMAGRPTIGTRLQSPRQSEIELGTVQETRPQHPFVH